MNALKPAANGRNTSFFVNRYGGVSRIYDRSFIGRTLCPKSIGKNALRPDQPLPHLTEADIVRVQIDQSRRIVSARELAYHFALYRQSIGHGGTSPEQIISLLRDLKKNLPSLGLDKITYRDFQEHKLTILYNLNHLLTSEDPSVLTSIGKYGYKLMSDILVKRLGPDLIRQMFIHRDLKHFISYLILSDRFSVDFKKIIMFDKRPPFGQSVERKIALVGAERFRDFCLNDYITALKIIKIPAKILAGAVRELGMEETLKIVKGLPVSSAASLFQLISSDAVREFKETMGSNFKAWIVSAPASALNKMSVLLDPRSVEDLLIMGTRKDFLGNYKALNEADPEFVAALIRSGNCGWEQGFDEQAIKCAKDLLSDRKIRDFALHFPAAALRAFRAYYAFQVRDGSAEDGYWKRFLEDMERSGSIETRFFLSVLVMARQNRDPYFNASLCQAIASAIKEQPEKERLLIDPQLSSVAEGLAIDLEWLTREDPFFTPAKAISFIESIEKLPEQLRSVFADCLQSRNKECTDIKLGVMLQGHFPQIGGHLLENKTMEEVLSATLDAYHMEILANYESRLTAHPRFATLVPISAKVSLHGPVTLAAIVEAMGRSGYTIGREALIALVRQKYRVTKEGELLPLRPFPFSAYRGSREKDDPEAQYVTFSPSVAMRYGIKGGEAKEEKEGYEGIFEIALDRDGTAMYENIDMNVALAEIEGTKNILRKRFIRNTFVNSSIEGLATSSDRSHYEDLLFALQRSQSEEAGILSEVLSLLSVLSRAGSRDEFIKTVDKITTILRGLCKSSGQSKIHDLRVRAEKSDKLYDKLSRFVQVMENIEKDEEVHDKATGKVEENVASAADGEISEIEEENDIQGLPRSRDPGFFDSMSKVLDGISKKTQIILDELNQLLEAEEESGTGYIPWEKEYADHIFKGVNDGTDLFDILKKAKAKAKSGDPHALEAAFEMIEKSGTLQYLMADLNDIRNFRAWESATYGLDI